MDFEIGARASHADPCPGYRNRFTAFITRSVSYSVMNRALPIAVTVGVSIGAAVAALGQAAWIVVVSVSALYTGWSYFVARDPALLSLEGLSFEDTGDSIGYAVGLFGASVFGVGVYGLSVVAFVGYIGAIGFLVTASAAYRLEQAVPR
ncbi:hypothetical protein NJ7G_2518 [Natrinema sp. J7-2]|nr:hypothetical protein NJ7G_2518 [Natrinema sp. J7-2]